MVTSSDLFLILGSFFCPPVAVGFIAGSSCDLFTNICLTILGFFPGCIHAFSLVYNKMREKDNQGESTCKPRCRKFQAYLMLSGLILDALCSYIGTILASGMLSATAVTPHNWTDDEDFLLDNCRFHVVQSIVEVYYDLHDAKPIWAEEEVDCLSFLLFEASPGATTKKKYYTWEGSSHTLSRFEEENLDKIRDMINRGVRGEWGAEYVPPPYENRSLDELRSLVGYKSR